MLWGGCSKLDTCSTLERLENCANWKVNALMNEQIMGIVTLMISFEPVLQGVKSVFGHITLTLHCEPCICLQKWWCTPENPSSIIVSLIWHLKIQTYLFILNLLNHLNPLVNSNLKMVFRIPPREWCEMIVGGKREGTSQTPDHKGHIRQNDKTGAIFIPLGDKIMEFIKKRTKLARSYHRMQRQLKTLRTKFTKPWK